MAAGVSIARAVHARLLADKRLQFDLAGAVPPRVPHVPEWMKVLGRWIARIVHAAGPIAVDLFWVGVGAAVILVLFLIVREIAGSRFARRRRANARVHPADWRPEAMKAHALLEDADRLAAKGRYDEAVRLLLFRSIDDIEARRPRLVRPAQTARDIAALDALPADARSAFAGIAQAVERSLFGGRRLDADAFAACRADYETFAFAPAWT